MITDFLTKYGFYWAQYYGNNHIIVIGDKVSIKMNNGKERNGTLVKYEDGYMWVLMEDTKKIERIII